VVDLRVPGDIDPVIRFGGERFGFEATMNSAFTKAPVEHIREWVAWAVLVNLAQGIIASAYEVGDVVGLLLVI
jgi:hypothetical protein